MSGLRVVDFGDASPLRSQTTWHAVAYGVSAGAPPTLSFCRPTAPYVSIGFHSRLDEVDTGHCRMAGLPVYRRMVGGGPVYLDSDQHFFQISVPAASLPAARPAALQMLLEPAVTAFREVGVAADLDAHGEIVVGDAKICGHAAGQVDDAVVVVGNLITSFDHAAAARILAVPHADARVEFTALMRRYVAATPADPAAFRSALVRAYSRALDREPGSGELNDLETDALADLNARFAGDEWLSGPIRPFGPGWRGKVRAGVWVIAAGDGATRATFGIVGERIARARLADPVLDGRAAPLAATLAGRTLAEAIGVLRADGPAGRRLASLLDGVDARGLSREGHL